MTRRLALITSMLALALAAPAAAQQNPFGPLPDAPTATPAPVKPTTSDPNNTNRTTLFLIGGVLIVGFGAMGWFIMRDARSAIPEEDLAAMGRLREQGPHAHKRQAKAKARAKGRSQRHARKSNRPR